MNAVVPREDTPLLLTVVTDSSISATTSATTTPSSHRLFRQEESKHLRFLLRQFCSNLSHGLLLTTVLCLAVLAPLVWLRSGSNFSSSSSSTTLMATPIMMRNDQALSFHQYIMSDEKLMQWDEWKHEITTQTILRGKADLLTNDDSTSSIVVPTTTTTTTATTTATDDVELQDNTTTITTITSPPPPPTAWDKWWSNATELEREWWHKTSQVLREWETKLTDHSHTTNKQNPTEHDATKPTTATTTTTSATAWLSPFSNLQATLRDDTYEDNTNDLVYMNTSRAYSLLFYNDNLYHSQHYFHYQQGWEAQVNQAYCGVASTTALLNSINRVAHNPKRLPIDPVYAPHAFATQSSIVLPSPVVTPDDCVNQHVVRSNATFSGILAAPFGLGMYQVQALLQCYLSSSTTSTGATTGPSSITIHHVIPLITASNPTSASSLAAQQHWMDEIRRVLIHALLQPQTRVLINYHRATAGQVGGGHWSPLGSYHPGRDAFLIMDVAKYKYPAVWIPTSKLIAAMATVDGCSTWDFPNSQDTLAPELLHPGNMDMYAQAMEHVKCQAKYRGFIIVNDTNNNDN